MATAAELVAKLRVDSAQANTELKNFQGRIQNMSAGLRKAGMAAGVAGGAIVGGLAMAARSAATFEAGMREVNSMMGLGQQEFSALSDKVLKLSQSMGIDAVSSTKALYQAISAGVPKENALEFLEIASKAAIAGVTDTETAVDGLTTVINAFKLPLTDTQRVADILFSTVRGGKTTFEELSASMFNVAPIAKASGVSLEEVAASLATLTKQGVPTSVATTQLRAAIQSMTAPTKMQAKLAAELGIELNKEALEARGLAGMMDDLATATGGDMAIMRQLIGSVEGVQAVLGLAGENAKTFAADLNAVAASSSGLGAATEAYNEINKGASRQFAMLKSQMQGIAITLGNAVLPVLAPFIEKISAIVTKVTEWMAKNPELSNTIVKIAMAVGGALVVLAPLLMMLPAIVSGFSLLASPIGLAIAAIAGLVAVGILVYKNWEKIVAFFKSIPDKIKGAFLRVAEFIARPIIWAVNTAIQWINHLIAVINKIPFVNIKGLGEVNMPAALQGFQAGGVVQGARGQPVPIIAHGGERIIPVGGRGGGGVGDVYVTVMGSVITEQDLGRTVRDEILKIKNRNYDTGL